MRCSTFAQEHFTYNPKATELHLPVRYPREHHSGRELESIEVFNKYFTGRVCVDGKRLAEKEDSQMAFIRPDEIDRYIIPWLEKMQDQFDRANIRRREVHEEEEDTSLLKKARHSGTIAMEIPDELLNKIHLYNAMLQLGLPKFVQLPLIDAIVLEMYQTKLKACHLDDLEHTVGRSYSRGVAILDPVLNHLIGTYSFRALQDRRDKKPQPESDSESSDDMDEAGEQPAEVSDSVARRSVEELDRAENEQVEAADEPKSASKEDEPVKMFNFKKAKRGYLDYVNHDAKRTDFPEDTYLLPPELPVIGHCIRHWSGVRRNGSTAAAHTGFPLNIGKYKKFVRRNSTSAIDPRDYLEEETNRLAGQRYYRENGPG